MYFLTIYKKEKKKERCLGAKIELVNSSTLVYKIN